MCLRNKRFDRLTPDFKLTPDFFYLFLPKKGINKKKIVYPTHVAVKGGKISFFWSDEQDNFKALTSKRKFFVIPGNKSGVQKNGLVKGVAFPEFCVEKGGNIRSGSPSWLCLKARCSREYFCTRCPRKEDLYENTFFFVVRCIPQRQ